MRAALQLIASKSPDAMSLALKTIQAIAANSPVVNERFAMVVRVALTDPQAEFTDDERGQLRAIIKEKNHAT